MSEAPKWCKACQNTGIAIVLGMFKGPCDVCAESKQNEEDVAENQEVDREDESEIESDKPAVAAKSKRSYKRKDKTSGINLIFDESENDNVVVGLNNNAVEAISTDTVQ